MSLDLQALCSLHSVYHASPDTAIMYFLAQGNVADLAPMDRLVFFLSLQKAMICVSELTCSKTGFIGGLVIVFFSGKGKEKGCVLEFLD